MKKYRFCYAVIFIILLFVEILIGSLLDGGIVRVYVGDILVLPVIYFLIRIFWTRVSKANTAVLPAGLFLLGVLAELFQAIDITGILGIDKTSLLGILIGSVCDPVDILCYVVVVSLK